MNHHGYRVAILLGFALLLGALPATAALVINEIDYDQPSTDAAEFIELYNSGPEAVGLLGYTVDLINGTGGAAVMYLSFALPDVTLLPGEFFVLCANPATCINCNLDVAPEENLIQNGAPDAVGLLFQGTVVDAVSYEGDTGAPYTEGSGVGLEDPAGDYLGIGRYPDGTDTDVNNVDFIGACITPGMPNITQTTDCLEPVANAEQSWGTIKAQY